VTPAGEVVWIAEEAVAHAPGVRTCSFAPIADRPLPVGLRGVAKSAGEGCDDWVFVRFDLPGYPNNRGWGWYVPKAAVSPTPPRSPWDRAKATGSGFVKQAGDEPTVAVPVDDPRWTEPALLAEGEPVELLGQGVVRTPAGREVWIDPFCVDAAAPKPDPIRDRFVAGLTRNEKGAPLSPLPPAEVLAKAPKGQAFAFVVRPEWLIDARFSPAWFDPVGHTLVHDCGEKPRPFLPCGRYTLDYAAFGAWWPDRETDVIAVWDGAALDVVVIEPWADRRAVSPTWDGATPPPSP
jgi:hypothetical protein